MFVSTDEQIGKNVRTFREAKNWSQQELAAAAGRQLGEAIHQQTVLKIEKGSRPLRLTEAEAFARALEVRLEMLSEDDAKVLSTARIASRSKAVEEMRDQLFQFAGELAQRLEDLALVATQNHQDADPRVVAQAGLLLANDWGDMLRDLLAGELHAPEVREKDPVRILALNFHWLKDFLEEVARQGEQAGQQGDVGNAEDVS